jgi:hypothetical protein
LEQPQSDAATMPANFPDRLELCPRQYAEHPRQRRTGRILRVVLVGAFVLTPLLLFALFPITPYELFERLLRSLERDPWSIGPQAGALILLMMHIYYVNRAVRLERLVLTSDGIAYRSPMPESLKFLNPSWSYSWNQIRSASLAGGSGAFTAAAAVLKLDFGARKIRLHPMLWVDVNDLPETSHLKEIFTLRRQTAADVAAQVAATPLMRYIAVAAPRLVVARAPGNGLTGGFALEKNPRSLAIVVLFFGFVLYAFLDGVFLGEEIYVGEVPLESFIVAGSAGAVASTLWLRGAKIPVAEVLIVSLLFGAAIGAAAYPGALRLNAMTDTEGLRTHEYVMQPNITFTAVEPGMPALSFPRHGDYWSQFKPGSKHVFELRRGGLGFYQLNFEPVQDRMRVYYEQKYR